MKLVQVSFNEYGAYFTYQLEVTRGIRGKSKGKVNELLIIGIPYKSLQKYCLKHHLIITNKAVYENDLDNPILSRKGNNYE